MPICCDCVWFTNIAHLIQELLVCSFLTSVVYISCYHPRAHVQTLRLHWTIVLRLFSKHQFAHLSHTRDRNSIWIIAYYEAMKRWSSRTRPRKAEHELDVHNGKNVLLIQICWLLAATTRFTPAVNTQDYRSRFLLCVCCIDQSFFDTPSRYKLLRWSHEGSEYLASVVNASSTIILPFAEVSMNGRLYSSASLRPSSVLITFLSNISHLLPSRILFTPSLACCSMFFIQWRISKRGMSTFGYLVATVCRIFASI